MDHQNQGDTQETAQQERRPRYQGGIEVLEPDSGSIEVPEEKHPAAGQTSQDYCEEGEIQARGQAGRHELMPLEVDHQKEGHGAHCKRHRVGQSQQLAEDGSGKEARDQSVQNIIDEGLTPMHRPFAHGIEEEYQRQDK